VDEEVVANSSLYGSGKDLADESAVQEGISPQANESWARPNFSPFRSIRNAILLRFRDTDLIAVANIVFPYQGPPQRADHLFGK